MPLTDEQLRELMREVKEDKLAIVLLKEKAEWEGMSLFSTLYEWGDPRRWSIYEREKDSIRS